MTDESKNPHAHTFDSEVERAVLSVLIDGRHRTAPGMLQEICPSREYFFVRNHQMIVAVILNMVALGVRIDRTSIESELSRTSFREYMGPKRVHAADDIDPADSLMAAIGGPNTLSEIVLNSAGSASGLEANLRIIAEHHTQRLMLQTLQKAVEDIAAPSGSKRHKEISDRLITSISTLSAGQDTAGYVSDAMVAAIRRHDALATMATARAASWGLAGLDQVIPLRPGRFIVLAAQPGHGKTSLALQAAVHSAQHLGTDSVGIISLEVTAEELGTILLGREMGISGRSIEGGTMTVETRAQANEIIQSWGKTNVYLRSSSGQCTVDDACSWIRQRFIRSQGRLSIVMIDYLQLLDAKGRQTDYERFSDATRALKRLAIDLRICLLVLSQMNREGTKSDRDSNGELKGNPEPRLADLRGSGTIEQDADGVVFIWPPRESTFPDLPVRLKIAKNRGGSKPMPVDAIFRRGNGQVFQQVLSLARTVESTPENTDRSMHNHPPAASEDLYRQDPSDESPF